MEMTPEIVAAFEILRKNAVSDFELHRISVLEKDLTAPPVVEIFDESHLGFNGKLYKSFADGHFARSSVYLHREVYEYYCGEIPEGCVIHHKDFNPAINDIDNLQLLTVSEHQAIHNIFKPRHEKKYKKTCPICGREFETRKILQVYCSNACAAAKRSEETRPVKICLSCGKEFKPRKGNRQKYCSNKCRYAAWRFHPKFMAEKNCVVCGKKFKPRKRGQKYCSRGCYYAAVKTPVQKL